MYLKENDYAGVCDSRQHGVFPGASMPSFADDFTLQCAEKSPHEAGHVVFDTLGNVADALEMKLRTKTVAMFIIHQPTTDIPAVTCNGTPIKTVTRARLLGVIVDHHLSGRERVNHPFMQENRWQNWCARTQSICQLTPTARCQFFISVIQPDFEYASSTFGPTISAAQKNRLVRGVKRFKALRVPPGNAQLALC